MKLLHYTSFLSRRLEIATTKTGVSLRENNAHLGRAGVHGGCQPHFASIGGSTLHPQASRTPASWFKINDTRERETPHADEY